MLRNKIPIKDCEYVLRVAEKTTKLYQIHSNLKTEIENLKQIKNTYKTYILFCHCLFKPSYSLGDY